MRLGQEKERDSKVERVTLRLRYPPPAVVGWESERNAHKSMNRLRPFARENIRLARRARSNPRLIDASSSDLGSPTG